MEAWYFLCLVTRSLDVLIHNSEGKFFFFGRVDWREHESNIGLVYFQTQTIKWWWRGFSEVRAAKPGTPQLDGAGARHGYTVNWLPQKMLIRPSSRTSGRQSSNEPTR